MVFAVSATFWCIGQEADNRAGLLCHRCQGTGVGHGRWPGDRWIAHTSHFAGSTLTWAVALAHTASRTDSEGEWKQVPGQDVRLVSAQGTSAQVRTRHTVEGETDHLSVTKGSLRSGFAPLGSGGLSILVCVCE